MQPIKTNPVHSKVSLAIGAQEAWSPIKACSSGAVSNVFISKCCVAGGTGSGMLLAMSMGMIADLLRVLVVLQVVRCPICMPAV